MTDDDAPAGAESKPKARRTRRPLRAPWWMRMLWRLGLLGAGALLLTFLLIRLSAAFFDWRDDWTAPVGEGDVIIVLSSGLEHHDGSPDPYTRARTDRGVALWRKGSAPFLIMSGGLHTPTGLNLAEAMKTYAIAQGVPAAAIRTERRSVSTFENARFSLMIARAEGWDRVILVTDDFHLLRAWFLFEFWRHPGDPIVAALVSADGRAAATLAGRPAGLVWVREVFAYPFNVLKMLGQIALEAAGHGEGRRIR